MPNVLIAPNSYKESIDSVNAAGYFSKYLYEEFNSLNKDEQLEIISIPISDGGDGFLKVCSKIFNLSIIKYSVSLPYNEETIEGKFGYSEEKKKIYIESAEILGLKLIPREKRRPLFLSSRGLGELLLFLKDEHQNKRLFFDEVVVGIGGTGINDFGIGMCSKLGLCLINNDGDELKPLPINFPLTKEIIWKGNPLPFKISVILDVNIPLLGETGASRTFAPQKGATFEEVEQLENGITNLIEILKAKGNNRIKNLSGAGGGLGAAFYYFLNAEYKFAKEFISEDLGINKNSLNVNLIVTGEGHFDSQSFLQKGCGLIIDEFRNTQIPVCICAGRVTEFSEMKNISNLYFIELAKYFRSNEESITKIKDGIKLASKEIVRHFLL